MVEAIPHNWTASTLGHGETMCTRCKITNREAAALGCTDECDVPPPPAVIANDDYEDHLDDCVDDDDCWNCGGEGFVSNCFEEFACIDPEGGCDLCTKRCDVCNPPRPTTQKER